RFRYRCWSIGYTRGYGSSSPLLLFPSFRMGNRTITACRWRPI
ncbi:uncharacterized protein METZ01_LOCUS235863, partial [marine metagenome]